MSENKEEVDIEKLLEEERIREELEEQAYMKSLIEVANKKSFNDYFIKEQPISKDTSKKIPKINKVSNKNNKTSLSLSEFTKKIDDDIKNTKPKKFISKRADEKRKELGIDDEIVSKRSFNPRKIPYNFVDRIKYNMNEINISNTMDFPSL
jgi:hypothetical protein